MMTQLQGFAAMSQMKRLALLLLARTFADKDVLRLKVFAPLRWWTCCTISFVQVASISHAELRGSACI